MSFEYVEYWSISSLLGNRHTTLRAASLRANGTFRIKSAQSSARIGVNTVAKEIRASIMQI